MTFEENLKKVQKELGFAGYSSVFRPINIGALDKEEAIQNCKIISSKDQYNVLYMEAESNWKGIATNVAKNQKNPCLVVTSYKDSYIILSTVKDIATTEPKPRHLIIDEKSKTHSMQNFIKLIKAGINDDFVSIDNKVQNAFDKFSEYKEALDDFAENLEKIIKNTESLIDKAISGNTRYDDKARKFLKICQKIINKDMGMDDIKSMLIQHILTYRIFALVYDERDFHSKNTVAKQLESLKKLLELSDNSVNYQTIELVAESIIDSDQQQEFLKRLYETFYTKYDPAKADKDGIVYTPTQVVKFMVKSTDKLLKKHFDNTMSDDNVHILDPATGTGTFIVEILKNIKSTKLLMKYEKEIHANEISILPYYIAALNIEQTYAELSGRQNNFEQICWMDTLDARIKSFEKITKFTGMMDNINRISKQQNTDICIVIGNPPFNARQESANEENPSGYYPELDEMIARDFTSKSKAKKTFSTDMYKRFLKWSSKRLDKKGIIAFISNNSFLDAIGDDGLRKAVYEEFDHIYTVNLKGNSKKSDRKNQGQNIFNIQIGIAITFFVKTGKKTSELRYIEAESDMTKNEKLNWLGSTTILKLDMKRIYPSKDGQWLNKTRNDFKSLVPLVDENANSIFHTRTLGTQSSKDEWAFDFDRDRLKAKINYFITQYNESLNVYKKLLNHITRKSDKILRAEWARKNIKWSRRLYNLVESKKELKYETQNIIPTLYRPFVIKLQYYAKNFTEEMRNLPSKSKNTKPNKLILYKATHARGEFGVLASDRIHDLALFDGTQTIPLYNYENDNGSNITEWGRKLFRKYYNDPKISNENIFYYVYAILSDPKYVKKYEKNLKSLHPRIPLAENFHKWSKIGEKLFKLHINFEDEKEYNVERIDIYSKHSSRISKLELDRSKSIIIIDDITTLSKIPKNALRYTLAKKSPLETILTHYKKKKNTLTEKKGSDDERIRDRFNTYDSTHYKEQIISLLRKTISVCIKSFEYQTELTNLAWGQQTKFELLMESSGLKTKDDKNKKKSKKRNAQKYHITNMKTLSSY